MLLGASVVEIKIVVEILVDGKLVDGSKVLNLIVGGIVVPSVEVIFKVNSIEESEYVDVTI
jgi:hypothetical protein